MVAYTGASRPAKRARRDALSGGGHILCVPNSAIVWLNHRRASVFFSGARLLFARHAPATREPRPISPAWPTQRVVMISSAACSGRAWRWRERRTSRRLCRQCLSIDWATLSVAVDRRRRARRHLDPCGRGIYLVPVGRSHSHHPCLRSILSVIQIAEFRTPDHLRQLSSVVMLLCTDGRKSAVTG